MTTIIRSQPHQAGPTSTAAAPGYNIAAPGYNTTPATPTMPGAPPPGVSPPGASPSTLLPCPVQVNPIQAGPSIPPNTAYDGTQDPNVGSALTMRDLMRENVGEYVVCEHLVGTSGLVTKEGRLKRVEANAYVLEDPRTGDQTHCDYFSLKFFRTVNQDDGSTGAMND